VSQATLERFYIACQSLDNATIQACYTPAAKFQDPAFNLSGSEQIGGMWHMLCHAARQQGPQHWRLEFSQLQARGRKGAAHREPQYLLTATGKAVHNKIDARFEFDEAGLISLHQDSFDFWRWSRQALGWPGLLLGWTPWMRHKMQRQARRNLQRFMQRN